jgi:hypothetical protein
VRSLIVTVALSPMGRDGYHHQISLFKVVVSILKVSEGIVIITFSHVVICVIAILRRSPRLTESHFASVHPNILFASPGASPFVAIGILDYAKTAPIVRELLASWARRSSC